MNFRIEIARKKLIVLVPRFLKGLVIVLAAGDILKKALELYYARHKEASTGGEDDEEEDEEDLLLPVGWFIGEN